MSCKLQYVTDRSQISRFAFSMELGVCLLVFMRSNYVSLMLKLFTEYRLFIQ